MHQIVTFFSSLVYLHDASIYNFVCDVTMNETKNVCWMDDLLTKKKKKLSWHVAVSLMYGLIKLFIKLVHMIV